MPGLSSSSFVCSFAPLCLAAVVVLGGSCGCSDTVPQSTLVATPSDVDDFAVENESAAYDSTNDMIDEEQAYANTSQGQEAKRQRNNAMANQFEQQMMRRAATQAYAKNDLEQAVRLFNQLIRKYPEREPWLWERGIALYQLGQFRKAAKQFETHYTVNENDVENTAWHLICVARSPGQTLELARRKLIEIDPSLDSRAVMSPIYELYAGRGSEEEVLKMAVEPRDVFYANLYIGLLREAAGDAEGARPFLEKAAELGKEMIGTMGAVPVVHLQRLDNPPADQ